MKLDKKTRRRIRRAKQERLAKAARLAEKQKRRLLNALVALGV